MSAFLVNEEIKSILLNYLSLDVLIHKIKEREFLKDFCRSIPLFLFFIRLTRCTIHNLIIMLKKKNRSKTFFLRMILAVKSSKEAEKCGKKVTKKNTCGAKCSFCQLASFRQLKRAPTLLHTM